MYSLYIPYIFLYIPMYPHGTFHELLVVLSIHRIVEDDDQNPYEFA